MRSIRAIGLAGGLAVVLSACGSSGPSQSRFVDSVNLICTRADSALGVSPRSIKSLPAFGREIQRDLPIYLEELKQMRAVRVPGGSQGDYAALLRLIAVQDTLLHKAIAPLLANHLELAKRFTGRLPATSLALYKAEVKLGLLVCAKST